MKLKLLLLPLIILVVVFCSFFIAKKNTNFDIYKIDLYSDDFELENYQIIKSGNSYYIPDTYSIKGLGDYKLLSDVSFSVKHKNEYLTTTSFNFPNENIVYSNSVSLNNKYTINNNDELIFTFKYKKNNELKEIFHTVKLEKYKQTY